jgi:hypothetical protein
MSHVTEPTINYKVNVPTYIMGDELVTPARGKGHEREELIVDEGDVYESDKSVTTHQFSDNQEEQTDFQNLLTTKLNEETDSKMSQVSEPRSNYKVNVPTYIMGDELVTPARGKGHEREELIVDEGDVYESDKPVTTHQFSDNQEEQTNSQTDFQNSLTAKETENVENSGILKAGISKEEQEASYITAPHIPNISDTYETTSLETTTFQTAVTPVGLMNTIATSNPTDRSDTPQSTDLTIQGEDGRTDPLDKGLVQKDDPHRREYDTAPSSHPAAPQDKYYNGDETRSPSVDVWNQNDAKGDTVAEQRNHSDDTNIYQEHVSDISVDEAEGLEPFQFIAPTTAPQQNGVTSNYIQLYETQMGKNAQPLPETQNKQNDLISSEQSTDEYILPLETTDPADALVLQHFTLGLQKSESLPTRNISLENIVDKTKSLYNTVNSTNIMNKPLQEHNTIQSIHSPLQQTDESIHSPLQQTAEPKYTHNNRNEVLETVMQYTSPDSVTEQHRDRKQQECYVYCNSILNSRSNGREDMTQEGTRTPTAFPPGDISGILKEHTQSRNGIASAMELMQPVDLGDTLKPDYVSRILTENETPEYETEAGKEYELDATRAMAENRQAEGDRTGYKQMEEESEDITDYREPEEVTMQDYEWLHDPRTVRRGLQGEYIAEEQSGAVTEQEMPLQGASKTTKNFHTIRQSGEDTRHIMNAYKNTLMLLLQNREKIQSLLDLPYSYAMTSPPPTTIRREDQSRLNEEPVIDQGHIAAINWALNRIKLPNADYRSVETTRQPNHVITNYIKSNDLSQIESLREKNRQGKSFEDTRTTKSDGRKTTGTFNNEYNSRYHETMQQPSPAYMGAPVNVDRSELEARIRDSDDTWGTPMDLAHLPSQDSMRTGRSNCGPWALYKNYLCMPAASPSPDHQLLLSDTVPTYSYEPGYGFVMDSSLESDKMTQDLSQNVQDKHHSRNYNVQRSDILSEEEMVLENIIIDYDDEENQSHSDYSMTDTYNAFDSPRLFKFYMYNDDTSLRPKLYNKRKSNSNHNTVYIPEESYQKLVETSVVSRRPGSMGNWKNYKASSEDTHLIPSAFRQRSSDDNTNQENIRSFPLGLQKREINERYKDDNGEIWYYKSGKEEYEQSPEWGFLNTDDRQSSSFSEAYEQLRDHSHHQDCGEETTIEGAPQISLKNANQLFDGDIIRMPVNDLSHNTEVFNTYTNNYKKKLPSEKMQKISKNIYKYSHDYKYPTKHHTLAVKDDGWQYHNVHRPGTQHLLHQNNHILHQPEDNDNSWDDGYKTNESDDNSVIRRTRSARQYTTGSSEENERDLYPQYQSRSCQSYNCEGVLASEVKIVTAILKWLKNIVTNSKRI